MLIYKDCPMHVHSAFYWQVYAH